MLLVGAFAVSNTLYDRFERFFAQNRIEDGEFKTETPLTDADIRALEGQYEVVLEQQHYTDLTYQDTKLRILHRWKSWILLLYWKERICNPIRISWLPTAMQKQTGLQSGMRLRSWVRNFMYPVFVINRTMRSCYTIWQSLCRIRMVSALGSSQSRQWKAGGSDHILCSALWG